MRASLIVLTLVFAATTATAQDTGLRRPLRFSVPPSDVDVLLATQAVLHTADMLTTAYDLSLSRDARETNPLLAPFGRSPVRLAVLSGAVDILQTYTVAKLQHRHPKVARWWALTLVGLELWTTVNNINAAGELQRRRAQRLTAR